MSWNVIVPGGEVPVEAPEATGGLAVILAHGAGSSMDHKTLRRLSGLVEEAGANVVRFNFLYRAQGRSMPDRMPVAIGTYRAVIDSVREKMAPDRLIIGGHSFGGRVASMLEAEGQTADGLILFGYPLHPPGQPEKVRDEHLSKIKTPTLQINGTADELCCQELMESVAARLDPKIWNLHWVAGADHSYALKKSTGRTQKEVGEEIVQTLKSWLGNPS